MVELPTHRSTCCVKGPLECSTAVYSAENGGGCAEHSASPLTAPGSVCSSRSSWRWASPAAARCPQAALSLLRRGGPSCCNGHLPRARRRRTGDAPATVAPQPLLSAGGSCRSAQPAPRPAACLAATAASVADARRAHRSANAIRELRQLRQRVSRVAGICLPAARWLPALFGPPFPAVCSPMPPAGAALLLTDNPP